MSPFHRAAAATALGLLVGTPAAALQLEIEVENLLGVPGFALTPVYFGFHDGTFDAFDEGVAASSELADLAEIGVFDGLRDLRVAGQPSSVGAVVASPSGPPPLEPGESASASVTLDPFANRALSFFTMLVPTNDTFAGNDDPLEFVLFDASGDYLGDFDIVVTTAFLFDAGSEVNDPSPSGGAAFLSGAVGTEGADENGVVASLSAAALQTVFDDFDGLVNAAGTTIVAPDALGGAFELARISVRALPDAAIPVPAAAPLLATGLVAFGVLRRRRKAA